MATQAASNTTAFYNAAHARPAQRGFTKRVMQTSSLSWDGEAAMRLGELMRLPDNWDGYGSAPIGFQVAHFAMNMLGSACPRSAPAPQIVPGNNGDVQIEWHTLEYDIEMHIVAPFNVRAYRLHGGEEEELVLTNEFSRVAEWLSDLETAVAARSAAA